MRQTYHQPTETATAPTIDELRRMIHEGAITPYFQPIVDLYTAEIFGFEVLSRGRPPFLEAPILFERAREWGLSWDLELTCRTAAIRRIAALDHPHRDKHFFLNVGPHIFSDHRFHDAFSRSALRQLGINHDRIVVEITETTSVDDYDRFEELIRHYVANGFRVALDDFGAGHSGFVTLVAMTPHFIKLDRAIVAGIDTSSYKQHLLKAVVSFASSVETSLVAEGVETAEELATVFRLGVRYAQGHYICRPQPEPSDLEDPIHSQLADFEHRSSLSRSRLGDRLSRLAVRPDAFAPTQLTGESLDRLFRGNHSLDHVVLVNGEQPVGVITRQHFYSIIGGRFGYAIYQKKHVDLLAKQDFLVANDQMDLRDLGKRAMERSPGDLYDPVVVVDDRERLIGTITMKQLLSKAMDIELKIAMSANPLTQLPGNLIIEYWIDEAVTANSFSIAYADLSNFKEFNDIYGFAQGDELIRLAARILQRHTAAFSDGAKLGHIGGDDFVIVADGAVDPVALEAVRDDFDAERLRFFPQEDIDRGYYVAENRQGEQARIPLVALGIGVIGKDNFQRRPHPGRLAQAAALLKPRLRKEIRRTGRSAFLFERRTYD